MSLIKKKNDTEDQPLNSPKEDEKIYPIEIKLHKIFGCPQRRGNI